jgi:hypothetical protein
MLAFLSLGFYCDKGLRTESNVTPPTKITIKK